MNHLNTRKERGQAGVNRLLDVSKEQPDHIKLWGITGASAVAGGVTVAAASKDILAVLSTLASLPVALTVGSLAGGALG